MLDDLMLHKTLDPTTMKGFSLVALSAEALYLSTTHQKQRLIHSLEEILLCRSERYVRLGRVSGSQNNVDVSRNAARHPQFRWTAGEKVNV